MANFYFNKLSRIDIRKNFLSLNFQRSNLRTKTDRLTGYYHRSKKGRNECGILKINCRVIFI